MQQKKSGPLTTYPDMMQEHEKKELRIIKQAIAKSFLMSGRADLQLNEDTERMMEEWIKWVYRDQQRDWHLAKEADEPF